MPKVVKMYEKSKGSLAHNQGPSKGPTRKEVKEAGSLREAYLQRPVGEPESRSAKIFERLMTHPTPEVKALPKKKKKPLLQRVGEGLVSPKTKEGLKLTTERKKR